MKNFDKILNKIYNVLGNSYLTDNFETEPFEFDVKIRKGDGEDDLYNYIVEVYSVPDLPNSFMYKDNPNSGIHLSKLNYEFKKYIGFVDTSFGGFGRTVGVNFMNVK